MISRLLTSLFFWLSVYMWLPRFFTGIIWADTALHLCFEGWILCAQPIHWSDIPVYQSWSVIYTLDDSELKATSFCLFFSSLQFKSFQEPIVSWWPRPISVCRVFSHDFFSFEMLLITTMRIVHCIIMFPMKRPAFLLTHRIAASKRYTLLRTAPPMLP